MSPRWLLSLCFALFVTASIAGAAEPQGPTAQGPTVNLPSSSVTLVDAIAARHALSLTGTWDVLAWRQVIDSGTDHVAVVASLYALRDGGDIRALLLVQRNVLPSASGWGPPSACDGAAAPASLTVYRSPRDVLCGWTRTVSFASPARRARIDDFAATRLGRDASKLNARPEAWLWFGLRVSNRSDFLDIQLLVPNAPALPQPTQAQFLADMAHSMDATWLTASLGAVPAPPVPSPAMATPDAEPAGGSWWTGTLSASALKTATYRAGVSVKTFLVASLMAGDAATGGAIITVLNFTSTGLYLMNDYLWETWRPLTQPPQDFVRLVEAPRPDAPLVGAPLVDTAQADTP